MAALDPRPGAVVVDRNVLEWRCDPTSEGYDARVDSLDRRLIVMCNEGYASSLAAVTLQELGFENATDLDGGFQAWRAAGLPGHTVTSLAVSAVERGVVYAGTMPPLVFVSRDEGANWRELDAFRHIGSRWWWRSPAEPSLTAYVQSIALSPTNQNVIVAGIEAGAVVRSDDGISVVLGNVQNLAGNLTVVRRSSQATVEVEAKRTPRR